MTWTPSGNFLLNQAIADVSTTKKHQLGTIVQCKDPNYGMCEFIYLDGVASCAAKTWVTYKNEDFTAVRLAADAIGNVAIAMGACTASYYGWFQIGGYAYGTCLTQMASNTNVWATGTAGAVDDTSVAGDFVCRARCEALATVGGIYSKFSLNRPYVTDRTSSGSGT